MTPRDGDESRKTGGESPAEGVAGSFFRRLRVLDDEAFTLELEACEARVRRSIAGFLHDRDVAADIFAETVATAYRRRYRFLAGGGSFRAWVEQIAHNKIREYFRRCRTRREVVLPDASQFHRESLGQDEALVAQEDAARLALSLGGLGASQQMVLRLYYGEGMSVRDIATELGLGEDTVKKRLSRSRQRLREQLEQEDVYGRLSAEGKQAVADVLSERPEFRGALDCRGDLESDS